MPRIRNIKPEFWTDEKLVELGPWERLLFIGLWNFADDDGFLPYSPKRIKMQIFPADEVSLTELLGVLTEHSLITHYRCSDSSGSTHVIRITNWAKHQKPNRPTRSKYLDMDPQEFRPEPRNHAAKEATPNRTGNPTHGGLTEDSLPERERGWEGEREVVLTSQRSGTSALAKVGDREKAALRIVSAWGDGLDPQQRPKSEYIRQITAQVQALVNQGYSDEHIRAGMAEWWEGKYPPTTLPNYVVRAQQGPKAHVSTGTSRAMQTMELVRHLEQEEQDEPF